MITWHAHLEGVAEKAFLTTAVEAALRVQADSVHTTSVTDTLVDIGTLHIRVTLEANGAYTVDAIDTLPTLSKFATLCS